MSSFVRGKLSKRLHVGRNDGGGGHGDSVADDGDDFVEIASSPTGSRTGSFGSAAAAPGPGIQRDKKRLDAQSMASADSVSWEDGEKAVYEQQLDQLQEQLMAAMMEKEQLGE